MKKETVILIIAVTALALNYFLPFLHLTTNDDFDRGWFWGGIFNVFLFWGLTKARK